ncbi:hypothetical protein [Oryzifoliimicrobium ureilyticus]|uniref:hypothetical protein n=1 Tax=Oryzifoliimicrobium ureilyticus TaxID=3113724 RepID=UPI0030762E7E
MDARISQGTEAWFRMIGTLMCEAAELANLPPDLTVSLVERYFDGQILANDDVQGIRFDIVNGKPSFRYGVQGDERGDVTIEISRSAARRLNLLMTSDPSYGAALDAAIKAGELRIEGDPSRLGSWLRLVHDPIVERTK